MRRRDALLALVIAAVLAAPAPCGAQFSQRPSQSMSPPRFFGGAEFVYAAPQREFRDYVNSGWGGAGHFLWAVDETGIFALRLEGGLLSYGHETKRGGCITDIFGGCRVLVDVTTSNNIVFLGIGPQLMVPNGRFHPYVNGTLGFSYFYTQSSLDARNYGQTLAQNTNYHDAVLSSTAGVGLYVPTEISRVKFSVDVGASYRWNGKTRYLREGSITDNPDGTITYTPIESKTDLLQLHLGVSFGAR